MRSLYDLCKPRKTVFEKTNRDDALDLSDLKENRINGKDFFDETFITPGIKTLIDTAFDRFRGKEGSGLVRLSTAMGGGKSHAMITLGLLSMHPELRRPYFGDKYDDVPYNIDVVAYTGRETDLRYGLWGEIASQLGKKEFFQSFYSPLQAPGQEAWINLLKGSKPILIMLDELPPYIDNARATSIGTSTLANVTVTALSNLISAVNKNQLSNVCLVMSDLKSAYSEASAMISEIYKNLTSEMNRTAMDVEPVGSNGNDLFQILRKRCFEKLPSDSEIDEVAKEYREALKTARQQGLTSADPDSLYRDIKDSYPFHPCIRHLFARFKENSGFQQTRGFIRLARHMVKSLWADDLKAKNKMLINAFDYDLKNPDTFNLIKTIKPNIDKAIAHDVSSDTETAMADECDKGTGRNDASEFAKLILMASLGNVPGIILGLSESEVFGDIVGPGFQATDYKRLIANYHDRAWYLYKDKDGRFFFRDQKNVNAELAETVGAYSRENAKQEIRKLLTEMFKPKTGDVYQEVLVFPAIDDISLSRDKITLILFEPNTTGSGLQSNLSDWYQSQMYKNRAVFLSGQHNGMETLLESAKNHKAIETIIDKYEKIERLPANNEQMISAHQIYDRVCMNLNSALKDVFVTLYYPSANGLSKKEIDLKFSENNFNPEEIIRTFFKDTAHRFETDTTTPNFRKRIESRIFTSDKMLWRDIEERAATDPSWIWYKPNSLFEAKTLFVRQNYWAEMNGMVDKNPPKPKTSITVSEIGRSDDGSEATLRIVSQNGDQVFVEIDQPATEASKLIPIAERDAFRTSESRLFFLCVDSAGQHETGPSIEWRNPVEVKYKLFDENGHKCRLKCANPSYEIKYSTDGSNPKDGGAMYQEPFEIPKTCQFITAFAVCEKNGVYGPSISIDCSSLRPISSGSGDEPKDLIDRSKPLDLNAPLVYSSTTMALDALNRFISRKVVLYNPQIDMKGQTGGYVSFITDKKLVADEIKKLVDFLFNYYQDDSTVNLSLRLSKLHFQTGADYEKWIGDEQRKLSDFYGKTRQQ